MEDSKKYDILTNEELILDYRPNEPSRKDHVDNIVYTEPETKSYSVPITKIEKFKPSLVADNFNSLKNNLLSLIDILEKKLKDNEDFNKFKTDIPEEYYRDIEKDTDVEVYKYAFDVLYEANGIFTLFKIINYKEDVKTEDAKCTDVENLLKVKKLEEEGNTKNINYFSMYIDAKVNKLLLFYISNIASYVENLYNLSVNSVKDEPVYSIDITKSLFNDNLSLNEYDRQKLNKTVDSKYIETALKNIYDKKNKVNLLLIEQDKFPGQETLLKQELSKFVVKSLNELDDFILDLNKSIDLDILCKDDLVNTLAVKKLLREAYRDLNNKT